MFLPEWREFPSAPCLAGGGALMTARVSMLLKSRASLTCSQACFLPGRAKDLSAPQYLYVLNNVKFRKISKSDLSNGPQLPNCDLNEEKQCHHLRVFFTVINKFR